ncbi:MAG TPA: DUF805 domain-containing protein [Candidatus Paceibacterota bacterium]|nr:DUF805 domain-containing protein [Candidatus Paceibacterota bacterium]
MNYYTEPFKNYAVFEGRATRKQYWMFTLFEVLILLALITVDKIIFGKAILTSIYSLASFLPTIAILVRRLHDTGRSAWSLLWYFAPILGGLVLLIFALIKSDRDNKYGPAPYGSPMATVDTQPVV